LAATRTSPQHDASEFGRDSTPAEQVVAEIAAAGGQSVVSGHDVSDWSQAQELVELTIAAFGTVDIVVNNAG
jgi:NAD(P)-dependent dehydrogenase (short-subunit alcohol dehydrogenase family)